MACVFGANHLNLQVPACDPVQWDTTCGAEFAPSADLLALCAGRMTRPAIAHGLGARSAATLPASLALITASLFAAPKDP